MRALSGAGLFTYAVLWQLPPDIYTKSQCQAINRFDLFDQWHLLYKATFDMHGEVLSTSSHQQFDQTITESIAWLQKIVFYK